MSSESDPFEPVEVDGYAPPLGPGEEWAVPLGRPDDRIAVMTVPEDAPPLIREGIARRHVQVAEGKCPCGGPLLWADELDEDQLLRLLALGWFRDSPVAHVHFGDCPANNAVMVPALAAWHESKDQDR